MGKIYNFDQFSKLYESQSSNLQNIIIGDSLTPLIAKNSIDVDILGPVGSEANLWKSGVNTEWLKKAVAKFPTTQSIKNVVIKIGTNSGFSIRDDVRGLFIELRRAFPAAKFFVVQGSWGWGNNKNVTAAKVKAYYELFSKEGATVIEPPVGYSPTSAKAHSETQAIREIGKNLDLAIQESVNNSILETPTLTDSEIIVRKGDPYKYKVVNDHWLAKRDDQSKWYEITGKDFKPGFQVSIDILDSENPKLRSNVAPKRENRIKSGEVNKDTETDETFLPLGLGADPEKIDPRISEKYNFHIIPDGKKTNYRSAQFPLDIMRNVYTKYNVKNVIRLNDDAKDGKHLPLQRSVSIEKEMELCKEIGCDFYKLSPTEDQDKINELLSKGNTLIHCAHGSDRTGGSVGGYLYKTKLNPELSTTENIWKYTTQYNDWNSIVTKNPDDFLDDVYLKQAQKFGVKDIEDAKRLAKLN
jgi:hypothetical protein